MSQDLLWKAIELPISFLKPIRNVNIQKNSAANEGTGKGLLSHNDLNVLQQRRWIAQSKEVSLGHMFLLQTPLKCGAYASTSFCICAFANLGACGWGCKGDLLASVYLHCLTLFFLRGTRAVLETPHEG